MNKVNFKFIALLIGITMMTILITALLIQYRTKISSFDDLSTIATLIQGTLGVAVSLAGAIVAIKLAQLSTVMVEKEKSREDGRFFHEVVDEALNPIKQLTLSFQEFYKGTFQFTSLIQLSGEINNEVDQTFAATKLAELKATIVKGLDDIIFAFKSISENQYSYALWILLTSEREKANNLFLTGGGARSTFMNVDNISEAPNYFLEDIVQLQSALYLVRQRLLECDLTLDDVITARKLCYSGLFRNSNIGTIFSEGFLTSLTLCSMYFNMIYFKSKVNSEIARYENKMILLLLDIYVNLPKKEDLVNFAISLFPNIDKEIINSSPVMNTFSVIGDSFWFSFAILFDLQYVDLKTLKTTTNGERFSGQDCISIWAKWQENKQGLYPFENLYPIHP